MLIVTGLYLELISTVLFMIIFHVSIVTIMNSFMRRYSLIIILKIVGWDYRCDLLRRSTISYRGGPRIETLADRLIEFCEKSEKYNGEFSEEEIKPHLESIKDNLKNGQIKLYAFDRAVGDCEKFYDV